MQSNLTSSASLMRLHSIDSYLHQGADMSFYLRRKEAGNSFSAALCFMLLNPNSILTASSVWFFFFFSIQKVFPLSKELEVGGQIKS